MKSFRPLRLPSSALAKNLLVFTVAAGVVIVTQLFRGVVWAETPPEKENKYSQFLLGKDFAIACESLPGRAQNAGRNLLPRAYSVSRLIEKYNANMNCIFNTRIRLMTEGILTADTNGTTTPLAPPEFNVDPNTLIANGRKPCPDDPKENLSTYCLGQAGVKEYFDFRIALMEERDKIQKKAAVEFQSRSSIDPSQAPDAITPGQAGVSGANWASISIFQKSLQSYGQDMNLIDLELDLARQSLDQALAAYNELQFALPLHQNYLKLMQSLIKYRDAVAEVRDEIERYPQAFTDVTTTQCT